MAMFFKMSHICSLLSKCLYMTLTYFSGFSMLNLWLDSLFLIIWGQRLIYHHECLAPMLYLVERHKFLFVTKTFHVPNINLEMKYKLLGKCTLMSDVHNLIAFGC
jgi:hypothetical protein